jgi:hypothetical protein
MLLERLALVSLLIAVSLAGCSDSSQTLATNIGGPGPLDTTSNAQRGIQGSNDRVAWGPAAPILPRGARFTVLRADSVKPPKTPGK